MFLEKYKVDGEDFKDLPLKVAYYARAYGDDMDIKLKATINSIRWFVENKTNWDITAGYEDAYSSSLFIDEQEELGEMLEDINEHSDTFDLIVVSNFYQISRDKLTISELLEKGQLTIPVFCVETGTVVTNDPESIRAIMLTCFNTPKEQMNVSNYYTHQNNEVFSNEE